MPAKFDAAIATADDYTTTNAGMGRTKQDDKSPNDLNVNLTGPEYNQQNLEIIAAQTKLGIAGHQPVGIAGTLDRSHDFLLNNWMLRLDRQGFVETWLSTAAHIAAIARYSQWLDIVGGAGGVTSGLADSIRACAVTLAAGVPSGWDSDTIFEQQTTRLHTRLQVNVLSATDGDTIVIGLVRDATHYVTFVSTRAGGAWPNWTVGIANGGAPTTDILVTGNPSDFVGAWCTFEIISTSTGADFYYNRGETTAEYFTVTAAPENAMATFRQRITSNVGGEIIYNSASACADTRNLFGP